MCRLPVVEQEAFSHYTGNFVVPLDAQISELRLVRNLDDEVFIAAERISLATARASIE